MGQATSRDLNILEQVGYKIKIYLQLQLLNGGGIEIQGLVHSILDKHLMTEVWVKDEWSPFNKSKNICNLLKVINTVEHCYGNSSS